MGNVLVHYDPDYILDCHGVIDKSERQLLLDNIFYSAGWHKMDLGVYDEADLYKDALKTLPPSLHETLKDICDHWYESLLPIPGMEELICSLKQRGFRIYLLSNAAHSKDLYWQNVPGHRYFDGTIVSAFEGCIKPERRIYEILLERYGLKAQECLFIDDMPANVQGARNAGMDAYLFNNDPEDLEKYIMDKAYGKEIN